MAGNYRCGRHARIRTSENPVSRVGGIRIVMVVKMAVEGLLVVFAAKVLQRSRAGSRSRSSLQRVTASVVDKSSAIVLHPKLPGRMSMCFTALGMRMTPVLLQCHGKVTCVGVMYCDSDLPCMAHEAWSGH